MKQHPLYGLRSVGPAALKDFDLLGVTDKGDLASRDPQELYDALCRLKGQKVDICCLDVMHCAVAQARDPHLPSEQRDWFWWSRSRKASPDGKSQASGNTLS
ncbi:MAG: helix-hairpin-helix domain-containing protein [Desulfovibrio sp.]|uniref:helix-hairpin-helix domain-containing protein n=1 Tax=Desulfovibrio sp. TaxID=885 RepID=UPI0039E5913B